MPATAAAEPWLKASSLPRSPTYEQMLDFFGIPPHSADRLDENINRKRRTWYAKTSSGNPRGREIAEQVGLLIQRVSEALKRGGPAEVGGGAQVDAIPDQVFATLEDLWRILSEYVLADDYDVALRVAREAMSRWGRTPAAAGVLAWVIATGVDTGNIVHPALLREGLDAAALAVSGEPAEPRNWESRAGLLLAIGQPQEAVAVTDQAAAHLRVPSARLLIHRARGLIVLHRAEEAMTAAVRAVHEAVRVGSDSTSAVRSQAAELLASWMATNLLPIRSRQQLAQYVEMVTAAAWCASGVPEAEDLLRPHRMWATNAGQRVFTGSWMLRSFLAVITGFISLPIHNMVSSTPAWQVLLQGISPQQTARKRGNDEMDQLSLWIVAGPRYVQDLHRVAIPTRLDQL
jgi:hypothetical protein